MIGSIHVRVWNRTVSYDFTLHRNITILKGDSATGKTTLIEMINEHMLRGSDSAVHLTCSRPCAVINGNTWKRQIALLEEDTVAFIDEGNAFVSSKEFAKTIQHTGHYYVIATREPLYELPYSVNEVYGIHSSGKYNSLQPVHHSMYQIYTNKISVKKNRDAVLTEDSSLS